MAAAVNNRRQGPLSSWSRARALRKAGEELGSGIWILRDGRLGPGEGAFESAKASVMRGLNLVGGEFC